MAATSWCAILVLMVAAPSAAESLAGSQEAPAEWQGIWNITNVVRLCVTGDSLATIANTDTICAGEPFPDDGLVCTQFFATADSVHYTCATTSEVSPGCTETVDLTAGLKRVNDTYLGQGTVTNTYVGACIFKDQCVTQDITAVRIDDAGALCATPVAESTWGRLKSGYR